MSVRPLAGALSLLAGLVLAASPTPAPASAALGVAVETNPEGADFERLAAGGVDVVALSVPWARGRREDGGLRRWQATDRRFRLARGAGLDVLVRVAIPGRRGGGCRTGGRCTDRPRGPRRAALRRHVDEVVARYGGGSVVGWQLLGPGNRRRVGLGRDAARYGRLLGILAEAVRARQRGAPVLLGPLAGGRNGRCHRPAAFLRAIAARDAVEVDAVLLRTGPRRVPAIASQVRRVSTARPGVGPLPLWLEVGWSSRPHAATRATGIRAGLRSQRLRLRRAVRFADGEDAGGGVAGLIWRQWRDAARDDACLRCRHGGLIRASGRVKPAWLELRRLARRPQPGAQAPDAGSDPGGSEPAPGPGPATPAPAGEGSPTRPANLALGVSPAGPLSKRDLATMREAGVGVARFPLAWGTVQSAPGAAFDWSAADETFSGLAEAGIDPLPVLYGSPSQGAEGRLNEPPIDAEELAGWRAFVSAAVRRYGTGGTLWRERAAAGHAAEPRAPRYWQVWNEPNAVAFWRPRPEPRQYLRLLQVSAEAIADADPEAKVMLGGMFGTPNRRRSIDAWDFLADVYSEPGARRSFDAVAAHPYAGEIGGVTAQLDRLRSEIAAAGDPSTELWVTEIGWGSVVDSRPEWAALSPGASEQARLLTEVGAALRSGREQWNLAGMIWYSWRDLAGEQLCPFCGSAGLLDQAYEPKPAYLAFRQLAGVDGG